MHRMYRNQRCRTMFDVSCTSPKRVVALGFGPSVWLGRSSVCFSVNSVFWTKPVPRAIVLPQPRAVVAEALATRSAVQMNTAQFAGVANREASGISKPTPQEFPQCPGEDVHAHAATQYVEQAEARWAARGLLVVANGGRPAASKAIVDVDLSLLPALAPESRDYHC